MARWTTNAASAFGPSAGVTTTNNGPRELTAQQLAGSSLDVTTDGAAVPRTRRARRANRRASQISTHSLPVYMKEPGEQEVIIYRGPEDMMEDPPTTAHVVMPSVAEGTESPDLSIEMSRVQSREYSEMPDSPHDMPLLSGDESQGDIDNSRSHLIAPVNRVTTRPSMETLDSAEDSTPAPSPMPDPRGEAPPYFEVVTLDNMSPPGSPVPPSHDGHSSTESPTSTSASAENPRRRSGLFGLFHSRHASRPQHTPAAPSGSASHRRDTSNGTNISTPSTIARPRSRAHSRAGTHRPSQSGSGFSMMSRSRSRLIDSPHLTSPSTISVNSISAPLTHTTVRTEFTYPRSGPTPEQIKLIASRESFARFGVPYGHDAIAFAASTSRMDLPAHPPPGFEEVAGPPGSPLVPSASSPTSNDTTPDDFLAHETVLEGDETAVQDEDLPSSLPTGGAEEASSSSRPSRLVVTEASRLAGSSPLTDSPIAISSPPGLSGNSTSVSTSVPPTAKSKIPEPLHLPPRAESRASSRASFATAEESLHSAASIATPYGSASSKLTLPKVHIPDASPGAATPSTISEPSTPQPSTPRILSSHLHENTDTTVTLATPTTPTSAATEVGRAF